MRKLFAGILILLLISSGACAEVDAIRLEAPETPEQKILFDISAAQTARLAANYAATASAFLDVEHEAGTDSDALYDFIARLESGTVEPTSVVLLLPTERFGLSEDLREIVSDAVADEEALWSMLGMNLAFNVNGYTNSELWQAHFLEETSVYSVESAWPGRGVAYMIRYYGEDQPQVVTALLLSPDSETAACKTSLLCFRSIAELPAQIQAKAYQYFGWDAYRYILIKDEAAD